MLRVAVVVKYDYISYISYIAHISTLGGPAFTLTMNRPTSGSFLTATGKQLPSFSSGELELEWRAACRLEQNHGFSEHFSHL